MLERDLHLCSITRHAAVFDCHVEFHDLRHTRASFRGRQGAPIGGWVSVSLDVRARQSVLQGKESPGGGDALELMVSLVDKLEARTCDEVLYGARHQDLAWCRKRSHASGDVDGEPAEVMGSEFTFACMYAGAYLDAGPARWQR